MSATAHTAWLDAWEGGSTPSPLTFRTSHQGARQQRSPRADDRRTSPAHSRSASPYDEHPRVDRGSVRQAQAIEDYDWDAAAKRRPGRHECERVILHTDRTIAARLESARYYGRAATARRPQPRPEARRRQASPRLKVVKHRVPRWRLGLLAGIFAVLLIGLTVVAPIMVSSAVAGLESAVGQAEAQQQQLAADTAALSSQISSLSSPQQVAEKAASLGLGPANDVSYLATGDQMLASEGDTTVAGR